MELSEFDISYKPQVAIKAQTLVDFIAELMELDQEASDDQVVGRSKRDKFLLITVNDSSSGQEAEAGVISRSPEREKVLYAIRFEFKATNNQVEYEAFIARLKLAYTVRAKLSEDSNKFSPPKLLSQGQKDGIVLDED